MWIVAVFSVTALLVIQLADRDRTAQAQDATAQIQ
jgi:hypothetical protein